MNPTLACCAFAPCCPSSSLPEFTLRGASVWPGAIGFGLLVAGVLIVGYLVLADVARALAAVRVS